jgi:hypothetical protein
MVATPSSSRVPSQPESDDFRVAAEQLRAELGQTMTAVKRTLYVERQALGLSIFDSAFHVASVAMGTAVGLALAVAAAILLVTGARGGMQALSGDAWWGDLVVAVTALLVVVGGALVYKRWMHRTVLSKTRRMLAKSAGPCADGKEAA